MKKNILLGFGLLTTLALAGCGDYNDAFEGLEDMAKPTDVKNISYTLTAADYGTISSNKTNTAMATQEGVSSQLGWLKNDKYFNSAISPAKYIPAFLAATWYTADKGSSIRVTYDKSVDAPAYLSNLATAETYEVSL
ncbi:MAG: choice-of-anchor J domain-containing protein, partial [Phocaeicola sp.]